MKEQRPQSYRAPWGSQPVYGNAMSLAQHKRPASWSKKPLLPTAGEKEETGRAVQGGAGGRITLPRSCAALAASLGRWAAASDLCAPQTSGLPPSSRQKVQWQLEMFVALNHS